MKLLGITPAGCLVAVALALRSDCARSFIPKGASTSVQRIDDTISLSAFAALQSEPQALWSWKGHYVHTEVTPPAGSSRTSLFGGGKTKPAVLLIHGFGCSTTYWRATIAALSDAGYEVHALDLLGQGQSAKPGRDDGIEYSINLWAEIVDDYAREEIGSGRSVVLCGNSLGSLVALAAATGDHAADDRDDPSSAFLSGDGRVSGICMFNCGVGLNSRGIANEPQWNLAQRFLINGLYDVLDALIFNNRPLLVYVLDEVVTRDLLRGALKNLYQSQPERVDDELVESFYAPAKGKGAPEALSQIYTNEPGKTPMDLHEKYPEKLRSFPMHLIWGDDDAVTPLEGGVGQYYKNMAADEKTSVSFNVVQSGHVPFDDNPQESNEAMLRWLEEIVEKSSGTAKRQQEQSMGLGWFVGR